jgi:hypothetical protein
MKKGGNSMTKDQIISLIKKHRTDIIVIASLLIISLVVILVVNLTKEEGAYAEVAINGVTVGEYSLEIDGVYSLNGGTNVLTIENGVAYMSYSNCPDHVCENMGKVRYVGETITCLPNRITITIVGDSEGSVDFIS